MRFGNVTGSAKAPDPALASPVPSMIEPFQLTVAVRANVDMVSSIA